MVFILFSLVQCENKEFNKSKFSHPFTKNEVEYFQNEILNGGRNLLLTPFEGTNNKRIINTIWFNGVEGLSRYSFIDSLLNLGIVERHRSLPFNYPILQEEIDLYDNNSTCELLSILFNEDGSEKPCPYYRDRQTIIAVLLDRNVNIFEPHGGFGIYAVIDGHNCF